ncbi:hypothetical protein D0Y83_09295 [Qipengyuania flava]|uniref:Curlin n=1 Tax=Qipengyuania flava TaxID=192812 RepID=A0A5P6NBV0_9SPHN|nr:hypothetical protein [Qipengyuania flava]MAP62359.1 hypothetical protein [Microbacterium sp.]HCS18376.1 hypothetical protein [Erythrobacter sp.]HIM02505.1 hypothetical protein [Myxococcales bacterium]MCA0890085.1 hypothetical protein [Qipengyuania flava]QFI63446.1 hypothetical protein D0Y83_09295 [Qipengyuania flava]
MKVSTFLQVAIVVSAILTAASAHANPSSTQGAGADGHVPPGNPCGTGPGKGTGNPCGGNKGNSGANGNASAASIPAFEPIEVPQDAGSGVFIDQIGLDNLASSEQENSRGYARVVQQGDENTVDILQRNGPHYAVVAQDGDRNSADVEQSGEGRAILILSQQGINNGASVFQSETGTSYSAAAISQTGEANSLMLVQDGEDNQARLSQDGSGNAMTATQLGASNRLEWAQNGDGLSDLAIEQTGGSTMYVLQTNGGGN